MLAVLARHWWLIAIRGVAAILFGVIAFVWPEITVVVLVALFAAYALIDGASMLLMSLRGQRSWEIGLFGVAGILAGLFTFFYPSMTALLLLTFIGAWAVVTGVLQIVAAIRLRREIANEFWLILAGVISVLFGLYVILFPGSGALALIWAIGVFAIIQGAVLLMLSLRLRRHQHA